MTAEDIGEEVFALGPRVLVIIPAYNEAENIETTVQSVIDAGFDYLVVNDGSRDNTLAICGAYVRDASRLRHRYPI